MRAGGCPRPPVCLREVMKKESFSRRRRLRDENIESYTAISDLAAVISPMTIRMASCQWR